MCKAPRVFIFGSTMLRYIRPERVCYLCQFQAVWHCISASQYMRSQQAGNDILLMLSYYAWISMIVQPWTGVIIMTWFVRSALCMNCHTASCFISRRFITINLFLSIGIGSLPVSANLCHAMFSLWLTQMRHDLLFIARNSQDEFLWWQLSCFM